MADIDNEQTVSGPTVEQPDDASDQRSDDALWRVVAGLMHGQDELTTEVNRIKKKLAGAGQQAWPDEYAVSTVATPEGMEWTRDDKRGAPIRLVFRGLQIQVTSLSPLPTPKRVFPAPAAGFTDKLSRVSELLKELQADFANLQHRVVLAYDLERALSALEEHLEGSDCRYLLWGTSLLKDVFSYNYAEEITEIQFCAVIASVNICEQKGSAFTKEDYDRTYRSLLTTGLCLLPNSEKAIAQKCDA